MVTSNSSPATQKSAPASTAATTTATAQPGAQVAKSGSGKPSATNSSDNSGFKQTLTMFDLMVFGLVMLVPISPFAIYGDIFQASDGQPTLSYLVGFICIFPTAFSFGIMIKLWKSSGSVFSYCYKCLSPGVGFVGGWMLLLQYVVYPALMYILGGVALHQLLPFLPSLAWAFIIWAFITVVSLMNLKVTVTVNRIALVFELIIFGMFLFFALRHLIGGVPLDMEAAHTAAATKSGINIMAIMSGVALSMLSYVGFGTIATLTQEAKRPTIDPPRATVLIMVIIVFIFVTINLLAQLIDPSGSLFAHSDANGFYIVASAVGGKWFGDLCAISLALAMGVFSGLNGVISVSRVIYVMAKAGGLPKVFDKLDEKTGSPRRATILVMVIAIPLLIGLTFAGTDVASDINNFSAMSTYMLVDVCVVWYCWVKGHDRHNWFTKLVLPAFGAIAIIAVMASASVPAIIISCLWCVLGIVIYLVVTRKMHHSIDLG